MLNRLDELLLGDRSDSDVSIEIKAESPMGQLLMEEEKKDEDLEEYLRKFESLKESISHIRDCTENVQKLERQAGLDEIPPEEIGEQLDMNVKKVKDIFKNANKEMKDAQRNNKIYARQHPNAP
eukprot:770355_1